MCASSGIFVRPVWETTNKQKYREATKTFQACHRACKSLRTARTLRAFRAWYADPKRNEIKNFGLQELTDVFEEMDRMRAGQDKSNAPAISPEGQRTAPLAADPVEPVGADDVCTSEEIP